MALCEGCLYWSHSFSRPSVPGMLGSFSFHLTPSLELVRTYVILDWWLSQGTFLNGYLALGWWLPQANFLREWQSTNHSEVCSLNTDPTLSLSSMPLTEAHVIQQQHL